MTTLEKPRDLIERWTWVESVVTGELERKIKAIARHCLLGCPICRHEEVLFLLYEAKLTMREALFVADLLGYQYMLSQEGKEESAHLYAGLIPVFLHDDNGPSTTDGFSKNQF